MKDSSRKGAVKVLRAMIKWLEEGDQSLGAIDPAEPDQGE
jgi:lysophospholipid acyltransferase (LPLAT)-like uncharacterized protein